MADRGERVTLLADVPAEVNESRVEVTVSDDEESYGGPFSWRKLWAFTGPGWLMSIAYLDPGNLESDLQAGAVAGYSLIWVLFWATVMGYVFQVLSVRLGVVTGRDLAQVCRAELPRPISMAVWIMTELAIIGSDIQEVVGSAIALNILFGLQLWVGVLLTACDTFTFMLLHYYGIRKLEALFAALIATMVVCFGAQFAIGKPDGAGIAKGLLIPTVKDSNLEQAVGMLGAVLMPHNIYLHSSLVLSRRINRTKPAAVREANLYYSVESAFSLFVSFLINLAVVSVFAKGFFIDGKPDRHVGLKNAGDELEKTFGHTARIVWAVGLLAAGQSSTMTGTFAGQYVMQGFLDIRVTPWVRTLFTRTVALGPALAVSLIAHRNMDQLSEYLNVLQSVQLPFALLPILIFNSKPHLMHEFTLSRRARAAYWSMCLVVVLTNLYLVFSFSRDLLPHTPAVYFGVAVFFAAYLSFVLFLVRVAFQPHRALPLVPATSLQTIEASP